MADFRHKLEAQSGAILAGALVVVLAMVAREHFLLFHALVEFVTVSIAWSLFFLAWNARRSLDNHFLLLVGIGSLFVGLLDLLHSLAYRGMGVFAEHDANLPTQLWIVARYLQGAAFVAAPLYVRRRLRPGLTLAVFGATTAGLLAAIYWDVFPACYVDGQGLTPFKIYSEYAVIAAFAAAAFLIYRRRAEFEGSVLRVVAASFLLTIAAELAFTLYFDVYGPANVIGHLLRFVAAACLYRAILVTGLVRPYDLLYRNLARSEEALRHSDERYRAFVANTSEGIFRLEMRSPIPAGLPESEQVERLIRDGYIAECNGAYRSILGSGSSGEPAPLPHIELLRDFVRSRYRMTEFESCRGDRCVAGSFTGVVEDGALVRAWGVIRDVTERRRAAAERERLIGELRQALAEVQTLSGLLPMCAHCKKIRDDKGYWTQVESYIERRTGVHFSHGLCPDCMVALYPEFFEGK